MVVLGVGDDALAGCVCADLARAAAIVPGRVVLHLSGALTSEVLAPLAAQGARPAARCTP